MDAVPGTSVGLAGAEQAGARLHSLTHARFFAALAVVLYHGCIAFEARSSWFGKLSEIGYVGVSFFFVLSGFVLAWSSRAGDKPGRFYWNRFARIWPIYALAWSAAVLYAAVGSGTVRWEPVLLGYALLQAWDATHTMAYNYPAWSLSVEALFYAVFPLVILRLRRLSRSQALVVVGLAYLWMVTGDVAVRALGSEKSLDWLTYSFPPYRLGEFVAGMALAHAMAKGWRPPVPAVLSLACLGALSLANAFVFRGVHAIDRDVLTLLVIPAMCLLVAAVAQQDLSGARRRRGTLIRLGEASYALYIVHAVVIFAWGGLGLPFQTPYLVLYVVLCVGVAVLLNRWVERPAEQWLRRHRPGPWGASLTARRRSAGAG